MLTIAPATPYWNANAIPIDITRSNTDRFRPDAAPGDTVDGLSLPQHDPNNDARAVQKHHVVPI